MSDYGKLNLVIFDSYDVAGDNGEYLYRRIRELYPEIKMTFLLSPECKDFERLKKDGFNVVSFTSSNIGKLLENASFILFSKNCGKFNVIKPEHRYKTVFLQHGVTARLYNDSDYLENIIGKMARYICCSSKEELSLVKDYTNGKMTPIPSGFPRHDTLLEKYRKI